MSTIIPNFEKSTARKPYEKVCYTYNDLPNFQEGKYNMEFSQVMPK